MDSPERESLSEIERVSRRVKELYGEVERWSSLPYGIQLTSEDVKRREESRIESLKHLRTELNKLNELGWQEKTQTKQKTTLPNALNLQSPDITLEQRTTQNSLSEICKSVQ